MTRTNPAIDVRDLTVSYGKRIAVDNLSLSLAPGELVALLGPNGAGKSTALAAMAGVLAPAKGAIRLGGTDLASDPVVARRQLGFADQPPMLYEFLTVTEHLELVGEARGTGDRDSRARLLASLGLAPVADRLCRELSFGTRQRVGLAAALVGDVGVVLLDETLNGLDPRAARAAREVLQSAAQRGVAVLMSTHLLGVAEHLCQRVLLMDRGALRLDVAGAELAEVVGRGPGAVEDLYLAHVVSDEP